MPKFLDDVVIQKSRGIISLTEVADRDMPMFAGAGTLKNITGPEKGYGTIFILGILIGTHTTRVDLAAALQKNGNTSSARAYPAFGVFDIDGHTYKLLAVWGERGTLRTKVALESGAVYETYTLTLSESNFAQKTLSV